MRDHSQIGRKRIINMTSSSSLAMSLALSLLVILPIAVSAGQGAALTHHGGRLLTGNVNVGILWYGPIPKVQRRAILTFFKSLNAQGGAGSQVSSWWQVVGSYQSFAKRPTNGRVTVKVVNQVSDPNYSLGKVLIKDFIKLLLPKATGGNTNTLAIIVAPKGVTVQDMCAGSCAQHGLIDNQAYVAVGDPESECPECSFPFVNIHGGASMKPPSGNVGADSMVMLLAGGLAGAVTNPYGDGFYATGRNDALLEATSTCPGLVYKARGFRGRNFVLPALWNPRTSSCLTA